MTWDRDRLERANFDMGVLGTGLAVVSLALALNKKPSRAIQGRQPVKFIKVRGQDRWTAGDPFAQSPYWFTATKNRDGTLDVAWTIGRGQDKVNGTYSANDLKEAAHTAEILLENHIPIVNVETRAVSPRSFSDDWYDEGLGPNCPNCGSYNEVEDAKDVGYGCYRCRMCGCVFDRINEKILYDRWDHRVFDTYRSAMEADRKRRFKDGPQVIRTEGQLIQYHPEAFDSDMYSALVDYGNPSDRSRILSFNRSRRRR